MPGRTARYNMIYPTADDLASGFTTDVKNMCQSIDTALGEVDDRHTTAAYAPVVRTTLAQLASAAAVTGQAGYVTADPTSVNNGAYVRNGSAWVKVAMESEVTTWYSFDYKMQNTTSFQNLTYGGSNRLLWNPALKLLRVDLCPFKSNVNVGPYGVYLPTNIGVLKPSRDLGIGQAMLDNGTIGRELTWKTDGSVTVGPEIKNGDLIHPLPNIIPIPSDVTVTSSGGTKM